MIADIEGYIVEIDLEVLAKRVSPASAANMILGLYIQRMRPRVRDWLLAQNLDALSIADFQAGINAIAESFTFSEETDPDVIDLEAISIAEDIIRVRLASEGFPEPRTMTEHALQLIRAQPEIRERAKRRVIARMEATHAQLEGLRAL